MTEYKTFLVGNDPKIHLSEEHKTKEGKITLIGTSGLRSIDLIAELGNKENTPKLIIIDNSDNVIKFWRKLRALVEKSNFDNKAHFLANFEMLLSTNKELYLEIEDNALNEYMPNIVYENQNPVTFMSTLIDKHGLDYVLSIIRHTTIIAQTWADANLFNTLKNVCKLHKIEKIYTYPSNIEYCIPFLEAEKVRLNIEILDPYLSIETDRCPHHGIPEEVYLKAKNGASMGHRPPNTEDKKEAFKVKLEQIERILSEFKKEIDNIGQYSPKAKEEAEKLHLSLVDAMIFAFIAPDSVKMQQFALEANRLINKAKPILQKDLGWGDYLTNLAKHIANTIVYGFSLGYSQGFFSIKPAVAVTTAEELDRQLQNNLLN
ncbi:hypothetical protein [Legionella brunensis]|uniref:hypothetical protein n=1 Tax=Legionella brunensis TaxID=29422 RepID=UPI0010414C09|nr:hypothetical protein [Legionella brunensis]